MEYIGKHKNQLNTPALVIDKAKLLNNLIAMQKLAKEKNVNLRPHVKTHKCSKLASLQLEYGSTGICAAKVSEAYQLAKNGIKGILITSPIFTDNKIEILLKILKLAPDTSLVVDNYASAVKLNQKLIDHGSKLSVLLDIDAGIGRTGIHMENAFAVAVEVNKLSNLNFLGIQCYAGHLQHITDLNEKRQRTQAILTEAGKVKKQLFAVGVNCQIQTGSGTGTFSLDSELPNVTEIQPGSYCVMDQEYSNIEYKEHKFLPAMTMLTTVISTNHNSHATVDAGTKALYRVPTKPKILSHSHLDYDWDGFGDEHGKVTVNANGGELPQLGEVLELMVAHCDPTINLFDHFYITENDIVVDRWDIDLRGCCQ